MLRSNYRGKHKTQGNTRPDKTLKENRQTPTVQCTSMYDPTTGQSYKIKRPRGHGFGPDGHQYKYVEKNRINPAAAGQKEEKANVFFFCFFGFRFFLFVYCLQKSFGVWFVKVYCFDCDGSCCATNWWASCCSGNSWSMNFPSPVNVPMGGDIVEDFPWSPICPSTVGSYEIGEISAVRGIRW